MQTKHASCSDKHFMIYINMGDGATELALSLVRLNVIRCKCIQKVCIPTQTGVYFARQIQASVNV